MLDNTYVKISLFIVLAVILAALIHFGIDPEHDFLKLND